MANAQREGTRRASICIRGERLNVLYSIDVCTNSQLSRLPCMCSHLKKDRHCEPPLII